MRAAYRVRDPNCVGGPLCFCRTVRVRQTFRMRRAFAFAVPLRGGMHQGSAQNRRQADPKRGPPHAALPGRPGAGLLGQPHQHLQNVCQSHGRGQHQEDKILFQIAHPTEQDFILLQTVLLCRRVTGDQGIAESCLAATLYVLARIGLPHHHQSMIHFGQSAKYPLSGAFV